MDKGEIGKHFMMEILPLLTFDSWLSDLLRRVDEGYATTFGALASALGTRTASRAVGERIVSGRIKGPVHRVVYSDMRVPGRSIELLEREMELERKGPHFKVEEGRIINFMESKGPLCHLKDLQRMMRPLLSTKPRRKIKTVAGMDISSGENIHMAGLGPMDLEGNGLGELCLRGEPPLPYIPGLLFYREAPLLLPLLWKAESMGLVDEGTLLVLDGNGTLHPEKMGIACHLGIASGMMTSGVAKKLHVGRQIPTTEEVNGSIFSDIILNDETVGAAMWGPEGSKPVYISPGDGSDLKTVKIILSGLRRTRIPEPTRRAHEICNRCRRSETVP